MVQRLRLTYQADKSILSSLSNLKIRLYPENSLCLICNQKMNLLKTDHKTCYSYSLGKFILISGCNFCADHKYFSDTPNQVIRYESNLAAMIVDKGYRVTFDLAVKIGRLRYDGQRQLHEIQSYLKCSPAMIDLPISTIGMIAKRFLEFCWLFHQSYERLIQDDINRNGGYFLHFDGSTEQKCGLCSLVLMDSRSGHILESSMVDSESYDTICKALEKVRLKYGNPLAVISDLRSGFVNACIEVFGKNVKHILCHYHFLRTFKDEFNPNHQFIKTCITQKWRLQAGLSKQLKSIREVKTAPGSPKELKTISKIEEYWDKTGDVLGSYRYVLCWILNYKQDSSGKGVPFDLPFLDLYHRLLAAKELVERIFAGADREERIKYYRHGFCRILEKTKKFGQNEMGFRKALHQLKYAHKWFNKLRAVLFLESQREDDRPLAPLSKQYRLTIEEAKRLPQRVNGFLKSLNRELSCCRHQARKTFLENLKGQIEKYRNNLHVPILSITSNGKEILVAPPRTNNCMEAMFRIVKSLLRRCSGRSKLPSEFGSVGALLPYYLSMENHVTFKAIFNNDKRLVEEFAKLFVCQWQPPENLSALPKKSAVVTDQELQVALVA